MGDSPMRRAVARRVIRSTAISNVFAPGAVRRSLADSAAQCWLCGPMSGYLTQIAQLQNHMDKKENRFDKRA
jgi:hypothetical protein